MLGSRPSENAPFAWCWFLLVLLTLDISGVLGQPAEKLSQPTANQQTKALREIKSLYSAEYQNESAQLGRMLFELAREEKSPTHKFVLYGEALRVARKYQDYETAWRSIGHAGSRFQLDEGRLSADLLAEIARTIESPEQASRLALTARRRVKRLIQEDKYESADLILTGLSKLAKRTRNRSLVQEIRDFQESTQQLAELYKSTAPVRAKLSRNPRDAEANELMGRFYFFDKHDFDRGTEFLSKGNDPELKRLSIAELRADAKSPEQIANAANGWWDYGNSQVRKPARDHAVDLYQAVVGKLKGLTRTRIEQRLANVAPSSNLVQKVLEKTWNISWKPTQAPWTKVKFDERGNVTYSIRKNRVKNAYQVQNGMIRVNGKSNPVYYIFSMADERLEVQKFDLANNQLIGSGTGKSTK